MLLGSEEGKTYCLRIKLDMKVCVYRESGMCSVCMWGVLICSVCSWYIKLHVRHILPSSSLTIILPHNHPPPPQSENGSLRDPVVFRCNDHKHWRTGNTYKVGKPLHVCVYLCVLGKTCPGQRVWSTCPGQRVWSTCMVNFHGQCAWSACMSWSKQRLSSTAYRFSLSCPVHYKSCIAWCITK